MFEKITDQHSHDQRRLGTLMETRLYEKKIIGGVISGAIRATAVELNPDDMPDFGNALAVCRELESEGRGVTADLLTTRLIERYPDDFYTAKDFENLALTAPSASSVFEAVDKVKGVALKTYLDERLSSLLADDGRTGVGMLDVLKGLVTVADKNYKSSENNFVFMRDIVPKLEAVLKDFYNDVSYAVSTGFPLIDALLLDGFSKGDLHIIVGLTGHGKSALALNFARYQATQKEPLVVGVVSREMSDVENAMRLQSSAQQIPRWQMRKGIFDKTYQQLCDGFAFDVRTTTIEGLGVQTRRMVEQFDMKILYVDYLQLIESNNRRGSRAEDVAAVSRGLKLIAMENNIPVVALSQFNRGAIQADVTDLLSHLKESSGLEQDASTVSYIQINNADPLAKIKSAKFQVLKNRNGVTFKPVMLDYTGDTFTFNEGIQ
jgi:replicative DNA helicase